MARISADDAQAWIEGSKLTIQALDTDHLDQLEEEILARIGSVYDTSTWTTRDTTPRLVRVIIAKTYVGWMYDKFYSENQSEANSYAEMLKNNAEMLISGIVEGTITIPGTSGGSGGGQPIFYPNDASSALLPTTEDPSLGPAWFSMGLRF